MAEESEGEVGPGEGSVVLLERGETAEAGLGFCGRGRAAENGGEGSGDKFGIRQGSGALGHAAGCFAGDAAIGEGEGLLGSDAFAAAVAFEDAGVVEGGEEAVLEFAVLLEVEGAAPRGFS